MFKAKICNKDAVVHGKYDMQFRNMFQVTRIKIQAEKYGKNKNGKRRENEWTVMNIKCICHMFINAYTNKIQECIW